MKNAIVIGRHTNNPDFPLNVIASKSVTFAADKQECIKQVEDLLREAFDADAALIFQAVPGVLAAALTYIGVRNVPTHVGVGVIISKPGPREAGKRLPLAALTPEIYEAVMFANPNAKFEKFEGGEDLVVDPPMKFEFSHIEWLF